MFLCAIARPRQLPDGTWWDGKIGIWPFGYHEAAKRSSVNRKKGTMEWKNESVTAAVYRTMLQDNVVPAISARWPEGDWNNQRVQIRIQQDGAKSHIKPDDPQWLEYLDDMNLQQKLTLLTQPANSPDLNHNDLGFFHAIEKAYQRKFPLKSPDEIIKCVTDAFWEYPMNKMNRLWLTRMQCMNEILECHGGNDYKLPHMGKEKLERIGKLPDVLEVTEMARAYL